MQPGMPNPMVEVKDAAEIEKALGLSLKTPEGATDIFYFIVAETMAEVNYYIGEIGYVYRLERTSSPEDISGIYDQFSENSEQTIGGITYKLMYTKDAAGGICWYDKLNETSGSLFMFTGANEERLSEMLAIVSE